MLAILFFIVLIILLSGLWLSQLKAENKRLKMAIKTLCHDLTTPLVSYELMIESFRQFVLTKQELFQQGDLSHANFISFLDVLDSAGQSISRTVKQFDQDEKYITKLQRDLL